MNTLRRVVLPLFVVVWLVLPLADANADSVVVMGGSIRMNTTTPVPFDDVFLSLQGPGFSLTNNFLQDSFHFSGTPNPAHQLLRAGTMVGFTGQASLSSPDDRVVFNGASYRASGTVNVTTSQAVVTPIMTEPFTLTGTIHGQSRSGSQAIDLSVVGSGFVTAQFQQFQSGLFGLRSINYQVTTIPEPGTLFLLGTGLAGLCGWRKIRYGVATIGWT